MQVQTPSATVMYGEEAVLPEHEDGELTHVQVTYAMVEHNEHTVNIDVFPTGSSPASTMQVTNTPHEEILPLQATTAETRVLETPRDGNSKFTPGLTDQLSMVTTLYLSTLLSICPWSTVNKHTGGVSSFPPITLM